MLPAVPMLLKDLVQTHSDYDPVAMETVMDFYEGGWRFERNKRKYLYPRGSDKKVGAVRMEYAYFTSHMAGKIDSIIGGILRTPPKFLVAAVNDAVDARTDYWHNLNADCDGSGMDLPAVVREVCKEETLNSRAYLAICTPEIEAIEGESTADAKGRGRLDCTIKSVPACQVDDWAEDGSWIRTYCYETQRANGFGPPVSESWTWRYYEADAVTIYEFKQPIKGDKLIGCVCESRAQFNNSAATWLSQTPKDETVSPVQKTHGLGMLPIVPVVAPKGFDLGGRMIPISKALFNCESGLNYHLGNAAASTPVLKTEMTDGQIFLNELNVIKIKPGDEAAYLEPGGQTAASLTTNCVKLKSDHDSAMQSLADQAKDRTSGTAQMQFREPKTVLMELHAGPVRDALGKVVTGIAKYRGEESLGVTVSGMGANGMSDFDVQSKEVVIATVTQFNAIPEMPKTARQMGLEQVFESAFPNATAEQKKAFTSEIQDMEEFAPVAGGSAFGGGMNVKTNAPDGMGADQIRQGAVQK